MEAMTEKEYQKQIDVLEQKLALYEKDAGKRGYFALNKIINQQIDHLNSFDLKKEIGTNAKEDATFNRTRDIWEALPKMLSSLNSLKGELKIGKEDEEEERKVIPLSPQAIAKSNTTGF